MMVSFIQSNYQGFGSGCVEPEFGISLQNRGFGFSTDPQGANPANLVAPGKRPFHTIIPAFVTQNGQPVMAYGVMGANMQPQGHVQTLVRMLDHGQNPQTACDAPRWRFNQGLSVHAEAAWPADTLQGLAEQGHRMTVLSDPYGEFGAGQFIWRLGDPQTQGYVAASDPGATARRQGFEKSLKIQIKVPQTQSQQALEASKTRASGLLLALLGAIAFSGKAIIVKLAYRHGVDAVTLLMYRMLFALPILWPWPGGRARASLLARKDWWVCWGWGFRATTWPVFSTLPGWPTSVPAWSG